MGLPSDNGYEVIDAKENAKQTHTPSKATQALDILEAITSEEIATFAKVLRSKTHLDV